MAKLNLSAIQNTPVSNSMTTSEINDSTKQNIEIVEPIISAPKKKISLNSLISWVNDEWNKIPEKEVLNQEAIINDDIVKVEKNITTDLNKLEIQDITMWETSIIEEKLDLDTKENSGLILENIDLKKEENEDIKEEQILVNISDGDTIWNLITDSTVKNELFTSYISSFDKDIEALKNKKTRSFMFWGNKKDEKIETTIKAPQNLEFTEKKEIDLDKMIEAVKIKEEVKIKEDIKVKETPLSINKKSNPKKEEDIKAEDIKAVPILNDENSEIKSKRKIFLKFWFLVFAILTIIASGIFYYLDFNNILNKNDIKVNVTEINNTGSTNTVETIKINNTIKKDEVNKKFIKYFKNKQNSVKIQ